MSIHIGTPETRTRDDFLEMTAAVRGPGLPEGVPGHIRYAVHNSHDISFSHLSDTFLVAFLPLAMKLGASLHVDGVTSLRLAHGIRTYQDILVTWYPETYQRIAVHFETLDERHEDRRPRGVGCCFSGGLDSFHAVRELLPPANRFDAFRISHALMINGFDQIVDLDGTGPAQRLESIFTSALSQWGVRLVMIHSNLKLFRDAILERRELVTSYGSALSACGHALAPVFGRFNLSGHATYLHEDLKPVGCHPALDHHLSSDQLELIHLGASASRSQKLEMLIDEPPVRETLRVCFDTPAFDPETGGILNCGVCEKCARTIIMLDILGRLNEFPTFRKHPPIQVYRSAEILGRISPLFKNDLVRLAKRHGHQGWLGLLRQADGYNADP